MRIFLIDYENVNVEGLIGVDKLLPTDKVIIFYTMNADKISFDLHNSLNASQADLSFFKVDAGGKNALDFQLSTYMGLLTAQYPGGRFYIVSKDTGFNYIINFWKSRSVSVQRIPSLIHAPKKDSSQQHDSAVLTDAKPLHEYTAPAIVIESESSPRKEPKPEAKGASDKKPSDTASALILSEIITDKREYEAVRSAIDKYKTKQGINNALQKTFGNTRTSEIYKLIQPFIKDKKGR